MFHISHIFHISYIFHISHIFPIFSISYLFPHVFLLNSHDGFLSSTDVKALGAHVVAIDLPRPQIWQRLIATARASPGKLTLPLAEKATWVQRNATRGGGDFLGIYIRSISIFGNNGIQY